MSTARAEIEHRLGLKPGSIAAAEAREAQTALLAATLASSDRSAVRGDIERRLGLAPGSIAASEAREAQSALLAGSPRLRGLAIAALGGMFNVAEGAPVQLLPAGDFSARDGRPGDGQSWKLDDAAGAVLASQVNLIAARTPVVIDYEHQTLHAATNGKPAPAAGWIRSVSWQVGRGLFGAVQWTTEAVAEIRGGRYRYISPVIAFDSATLKVTGLHLAALTNFPAIVGMDAVVA